MIYNNVKFWRMTIEHMQSLTLAKNVNTFKKQWQIVIVWAVTGRQLTNIYIFGPLFISLRLVVAFNSHDISTIVAVMHHIISFNLHKVYIFSANAVVCFRLFSVSTYFMRWNNNIYHNKAACGHKVRTCTLFDSKLNPLVIYYSANSIYICSEAINFMPWPCNVCV